MSFYVQMFASFDLNEKEFLVDILIKILFYILIIY
jgi:hypothetical protein